MRHESSVSRHMALLTNHSALSQVTTKKILTDDNKANALRSRGAAGGHRGLRIHALLVPCFPRAGGLSRPLLGRPHRRRAPLPRVPSLCGRPRKRGAAVRAEVRGDVAADRCGCGGWRGRGGRDVGAPARRAPRLALPLLPPCEPSCRHVFFYWLRYVFMTCSFFWRLFYLRQANVAQTVVAFTI